MSKRVKANTAISRIHLAMMAVELKTLVPDQRSHRDGHFLFFSPSAIIDVSILLELKDQVIEWMASASLTFQLRRRVARWAAISAYTPAEAPASTVACENWSDDWGLNGNWISRAMIVQDESLTEMWIWKSATQRPKHNSRCVDKQDPINVL